MLKLQSPFLLLLPLVFLFVLPLVLLLQVCRDCGQRGDERLLEDLCHERKVEGDRKIMGMTFDIFGKKSICSNCSKAWSKKSFVGQWTFTSGPPCVRVSNSHDIKEGEKMAEGKTGHNMESVKHFKDRFQCLRGVD